MASTLQPDLPVAPEPERQGGVEALPSEMHRLSIFFNLDRGAWPPTARLTATTGSWAQAEGDARLPEATHPSPARVNRDSAEPTQDAPASAEARSEQTWST